MCSKTSSVSYGNRSEEDDYSGLYPKKQKHNNNNNGGRRRVPRRGPGVAELEKIRLEEQQHNSSNVQLPLPPQPEKSIDKTGPVYPFPSYFSTGSFPNDLIPAAPVFHMKHDSSLHYLPPMSLPSPGSGGFYHFLDPPSNQTSSRDNVSHFLNEEKTAGVKRPWHFMAETAKCSGGPTITISRDGKQIRTVDLRLKNHVQDSGATIKNPITIDSPSPATPTTPIFPNTSHDFPRFLQYEQKEEFDREFMSRRSAANSLSKKPFYSFLPSNNEQSNRNQDRSFSFKTERYDTVTDQGIDLRLKL